MHMSKRRILLTLLAAPLVVAALTAANADSAKSALALPDTATIAAGQTARIDVLANDAYRGARNQVFIRIISRPKGMPVRVSKQRILVNATSVKPGTYALRYRINDTNSSRSTAKVTIRVTGKTPTAPAPTTTPSAPTDSPTTTPTTAPTTASTATPTAAPAAGTLIDRINALPVAPEQRTGYVREAFKHWNTGLPTTQGGIAYCDTRDEVLIAESTVPATHTGTSCTITGQWYSYYDGVTTTDPGSFDIDHMVPLAESWDSGASAWTAAKREAYANDQGDPRSLIAVTASSNRGKGDQDPGEWWPLKERCLYAQHWVAVKTRWSLSVDQTEKDALLLQASQCENVYVEVVPYNG